MTVEILQEVTDWGNDNPMNKTNGTYWVEKTSGNLVAFQPVGAEKKVFNRPLKNFSKTGRKFKKIGVE